MMSVTFIDTSVLCELLRVPGKSDPAGFPGITAEMDRRDRAGERFVIPVTSVIETGNHIAQVKGPDPEIRFKVADRLARFLRTTLHGRAPWLVLDTRLGADFVEAVCAGASTGRSLAALAQEKVGAGDVALLVERDQLLATSAFRTAQVWTLDAGLRAAAEVQR